MISMRSEAVPNHVHKVEQVRQIRGSERDQLGLEVLAQGISNVMDENICRNFNSQSKNGNKKIYITFFQLNHLLYFKNYQQKSLF